MKNIYLALMGVTMLAAGCGGGGGSTPAGNPGTTLPTGTVQITPTNAPAVAKGGMTPSQTTAKQGSTAASTGVVVQQGAPRKSVMEIALAQIKRAEGIKIPAAPAGAVGVIAGLPLIVNCTTNGTMTINITDTNGSTEFDVTDVMTISFTGCVEPDLSAVNASTTTNGDMSLIFNSASGGVTDAFGITTGTAGSPLAESFTMNFSGFSTIDTAPNPDETITMSGGMTIATIDNGTVETATMTGTSFSGTSTTDGSFTMKNFTIVGTLDSSSCGAPTASTCKGDYSFTVTMTTSMANTTAGVSGDIGITTTTPFTGNGDGEPTVGVMVISGVGGSSVTLTANANGEVTMAVNDGSAATQPVATSIVTWADI